MQALPFPTMTIRIICVSSFFFVFFREQKEVEACGQARFEWCRGGIKEVDE
jgi:hypothetical protein